jgi:hypothetical protein
MQWSKASIPLSTQPLWNVAYGAGKFVAIGDPENIDQPPNILSSLDAVHWVTQGSPGTGRFRPLVFGHDRFITVSENGRLMSSPDGVTWQGEPIMVSGSPQDGINQALWDIAYGSDRFVVIGDGGAMLSWPVGQSAELISSELVPIRHLNGVAFGAGRFVSVGDSDVILVSEDAIEWTQVAVPSSTAGIESSLNAVLYAGDRFVIVGENPHSEGEPTVILTSTNGLIWATHSSPTPIRRDSLVALAYGLNQFVAVGRSHSLADGTAGGAVLRSLDALTWERHLIPGVSGLSGVAFGGDRFVAVGMSSQGEAMIATSIDGVAWDARTEFEGELEDIAYGNGVFVATGFGRLEGELTPLTSISEDGIAWDHHRSSLRNVAFVQGRFLGEAFSTESGVTLLSSQDPSTWTSHRISASISDVTFGLGTFVAVGEDGAILQSDPTCA